MAHQRKGGEQAVPGALAAVRRPSVGAPVAADADVRVEAVLAVAHAVDGQRLHRALDVAVRLWRIVARGVA